MQMPVFSGISMFQDVKIRERKFGCGIYLGSLPYMDFDQNQEFGHFGKVTPPQRGRIPEIPIAVCFGAENPLFFQGKIASKCRNFPNFPEMEVP